MEGSLSFENLGINIIDEITNFLSSKEIVSLLGINQYSHKLWNSRISQKIFKTMPNFTIEIEPRQRWLYHQIRMMCGNQNYPKNVKITSIHSIYFFGSSFNPESELKLFLDGQITIWRPESKDQKIIKCSNLSNIGFAIHAYAYENDHLALMLTNSRIKHIFNNEEINEFEIRGFDHLTVSKMFYLTNADFLILQSFSGQIIYVNNNGEIISNRKLGAIQKYTTLPWKNDSFVAIINDKFFLIEPSSTKLMCESTRSVIENLPDFFADAETKMLIIHTGTKKSGWISRLWPHWIEFVKSGQKFFKIKNHTYIATKSLILTDMCCNHQYKLKNEVENIFIDGIYILTHHIGRVWHDHWIQLFIVGEEKAIILKQFQISIKVLNFVYPYIVYSSTSSQDGLSEVGFFKF